MTKKKSKKHKKERKQERPSVSSCEDKDDDAETSGSSDHKSKNKHSHRRSSDSFRSPREDSIKTSDEKKQKISEKMSRDQGYRASHDSAKHSSSSKRCSSTTKRSSSSSSSSHTPNSKSVPETLSKHSVELTKMGRPVSKHSHSKSSQDPSLTEEQRKNVMKRRSSKEDDYPLPKRHTSKEELEVKKPKKPAEQLVSEKKCQGGKEPEVRNSKKSEDHVSEVKYPDVKESEDKKQLEMRKSNKPAEDQISELKYPDVKESEVRRSNISAECKILELKYQDKKQLEMRKSNKPAEDHISELKYPDVKESEVRRPNKSAEDQVLEKKFESVENTLTKHLIKEPHVVSKPPESEITLNISHQGSHKVEQESALPSTFKAKTSSKLAITFKIPKKLNVLQGRTNVLDSDATDKKPSFIGKHPSLVSVKKQCPSSKVAPQPTVQRPLTEPTKIQLAPQKSFPSPEDKTLHERKNKESTPSEAAPQPTVHQPPKDSYDVPLYSSPQKYFHSPKDKLQHERETKETISPSNTPPVLTHVNPQIVSEQTEATDDHEMHLVEELHQARTNRQLQVNVVESYGELTGMDVDPPEEGTTVTFSQEQCQIDLLIVLDTNVLLSHLDFVKKIRSHGLGALGFPKLLVPWVVLQELDSLKSGKLSKEVEHKARPAVNYIYCCLKNQEPRLYGQSMQQASQAAYGLNTANNDDRVLQCCLQYQKLYAEGALILCTNDKNLCSKALLSGVKALSKADLQQQAEVNSGHFNRSSRSPYVSPVKQARSSRADEEEEAIRRKAAVTERELSECLSILQSSLQRALSAVLEEEMKAAFGELWTEIVYVKPPWTLEGLLQCFKKHWIAVFGSIIKRSLLSCVETLSNCFSADESVDCSSALLAVCAADDLLTALSGRSAYSGHVHPTLSCLKSLHHRLQAQLRQTSAEDTNDGDTLMAEAVDDVASPPQASHQEVWALFENIWNNVCNFSSALFTALHFSPGSEESVQHLPTCPPQDALSCLHQLSAALGQLLEAFQRLLSVDCTVEDAQILLTFIHTSTIAAMEPRFNAQDLLECLSQQEYREKLCVGGSQMMELKANLDRCAERFN